MAYRVLRSQQSSVMSASFSGARCKCKDYVSNLLDTKINWYLLLLVLKKETLLSITAQQQLMSTVAKIFII